MSNEPKPSATVVVIRDGAQDLEVLLLERNRDKSPWVFPGGKVDAKDGVEVADPVEVVARAAAVRESHEEAGLELDPAALIPISRWITPEISPKRFDTWFFLAHVSSDATVKVDGGEIRSHRWFVPQQALAAHHAREIRLAPPTFVSVTWLADHANARDAMRGLAETEFVTFRPRICPLPEGACMLYPGDAGYDDHEPDRAGARHRLYATQEDWRYERD